MSEIDKSKKSEQVKVVVRCRPMSGKETKAGYKSVINVSVPRGTISIRESKDVKAEQKIFTFDAVYDFTSTQEQLYRQSVESIVNSVLNGYNATIFAYGQTGTGKTYTMEGNQSDPNEVGVIPRSFDHIFAHIELYHDVEYRVQCSYIEIYQEEIKDLLDATRNKSYKVRCNVNNFYIEGLQAHVCNSADDMKRVMKFGNLNRKTGATDMNEHSSRSHAVFIIKIEMIRTVCDMKYTKTGKLNLVDLAGSERQTKSKSSGVRLKEATKINLSLSALGNVISALSKEKNAHIPYRDSKLTQILQDSLGGSAKTLMIANVGPASYNLIESLNTLKYANRAKNIKNKPILNESSSKDELILKCQEEVERLRGLVRAKYLQEHPQDVRRGLKRTHGDVVREDIWSLQDAVDDEESSLFETCEKIVHLQEWKDCLERQIGTDIKTYTQTQVIKLDKCQRDIKLTEFRSQECKTNIDVQRQTIVHQQHLNENEVKGIVQKIDKLHETFNLITDVTTQNSKIIDKFEEEYTKLETNQRDLLKHHGLNQIVVDNFIPDDIRLKYKACIDKDDKATALPISKTQITKLHEPTNDEIFTSVSVYLELINKVTRTNAIRKMKQDSHVSNSTPNIRHASKSKFKDNVIVRTNKNGHKEYIIVENEPTYQSLLATPNPLEEQSNLQKITLQDSLEMLKKLVS